MGGPNAHRERHSNSILLNKAGFIRSAIWRFAASRLGDHAGEGVGRERRAGVDEVDAFLGETRQGRSRVGLDIPGEIRLVETIDRNEEDVVNELSVTVISRALARLTAKTTVVGLSGR